MSDVTLPSGTTVTVKDVSALNAGDKLAVHSAIALEQVNGKTKVTLGLLEELKVATAAHVIEKWSRDAEVSIEGVLSLGLEDYDALMVAIQAHSKLLGMGADKSKS
jgi:hypothetical protein